MKQKGKAVPATQGRTRNQPAGSNFVQKSGMAQKPWANSREPVHPKFTKGNTTERKD